MGASGVSQNGYDRFALSAPGGFVELEQAVFADKAAARPGAIPHEVHPTGDFGDREL